VLALWSDQGGLASWYAGEGGTLALWRSWAEDVQGHAIRGGHFFPEAAPEATIAALRGFFAPP
jgi:haloacetate dehalogenase